MELLFILFLIYKFIHGTFKAKVAIIVRIEYSYLIAKIIIIAE